MIAALLGDVHANLPALEVVLAHARQNGAQVVWNTGDFVGYGPFPNEVVERLRAEGAISILGNYDHKSLKARGDPALLTSTRNPDKRRAFLWAYQTLTPENRAYLLGLPEQLSFKAEDWRVLLVHGSPADPLEHLTPNTSEEHLRELANTVSADIIICGHSHLPFARAVASTWFINTGSVGRPDDGDPRACYALLSLEQTRISVQHFRLEYDIERTVRAARSAQLPESFVQMLRQGRSLNKIQTQSQP